MVILLYKRKEPQHNHTKILLADGRARKRERGVGVGVADTSSCLTAIKVVDSGLIHSPTSSLPLHLPQIQKNISISRICHCTMLPLLDALQIVVFHFPGMKEAVVAC